MPHFFTLEEGNMLIRLLLAHIAADFLFQTDKMVQSKNWIKPAMLLHILFVFLLTWLFSGLWKAAVCISLLHWMLDVLKVHFKKRNTFNELILFTADQLLHLLVIVGFWLLYYQLWAPVTKAVVWPFTHYKTSLLLLGYSFVIWPLGYLLKYVLQQLPLPETSEQIKEGGKLIGRFERIIILTFVLLGSYEAIGFLITGKAIIRFAEKDKITSEYVLVGTMMSYAISIIIGVLLNWLLSLTL